MFVSNLSYKQAVAVTPSDSTDLPRGVTRGIYSGAGGTIVVQMEDASLTVTLASVPAGQILPLAVKRVLATGTTATGVHALY